MSRTSFYRLHFLPFSFQETSGSVHYSPPSAHFICTTTPRGRLGWGHPVPHLQSPSKLHGGTDDLNPDLVTLLGGGQMTALMQSGATSNRFGFLYSRKFLPDTPTHTVTHLTTGSPVVQPTRHGEGGHAIHQFLCQAYLFGTLPEIAPFPFSKKTCLWTIAPQSGSEYAIRQIGTYADIHSCR